MFSRSKRLIFSIILGVSVLNSCVKEITDDIDDLQTGDDIQNWIFPLINSDIQVTDFDSVDLKVRDDGTVYYTSQVDSVVIINPDSVFMLPQQSVHDTTFSFEDVNTVPYSRDKIFSLQTLFSNNASVAGLIGPLNGLTLPIPPIAPLPFGTHNLPLYSEFDFINYDSGLLNVKVSNESNVPFNSIEIAVTNSITGNLLGTVFFTSVDAFSTESQQINMAGQLIHNNVHFEILQLGTPGTTSPVTIDLNQVFAVTVESTTDMVVNNARAIFSEPMFQRDIEYPFRSPDGSPLYEELTEIKFKTGSLRHIIRPTLETSMTLDAEILGSTSTTGPSPLAFTGDYPAGLPSFFIDETEDLADYTIPLNNYPGQPYNNLTVRFKPVQFQTGLKVNFNKNQQFQVTLLLQNISYVHVKGRFKERTFPIEENIVDWADDIFSHIYGKIEVEDSKIHIQSRTNIGVDFSAELFGVVYDVDEELLLMDFQEDALLIGPEQAMFGLEAQHEFTYDQNNSNADEIVSFLPYKMRTRGNATINKGKPSRECYINDEAYGVFDVEFETPLHLWADTLFYNDTLVYDNADLDDLEDLDTTKFVNSVFLHMYVTNDLPLNIEANILIVDSVDATTDTLLTTIPYEKVIQGAPVDVDGNKTGSTKYERVLELSKAQRLSLINGDKVVVEAAVITSQFNGDSPFVRIKDTDHFKLNLSVEIENYIPVE